MTAYDAYGNVATGYRGTVALSSTDPEAVRPSSYVFTTGDAGQHSFGIMLETAGMQSITVTDQSTSSLTATESNITVDGGRGHVVHARRFSQHRHGGHRGHRDGDRL